MLAVASQQRRYGHFEVLAQQVEEGGLDCGEDVDRRPEIEGLQASAGGVAVGERGADPVEDLVVGREVGPENERFALFRVAVMFSPPGTSPSPRLPWVSSSTRMLRVK